MKTITAYILLVLTAAGCMVNDKVEYDPQMQMQFQPVMHVPTKARSVMEDYPRGQTFAISAWTLDKSMNWDSHASQASQYLLMEPVYFSEEFGWNLECGELWPERRLQMTVIGYTPIISFSGCSWDKGMHCTYDIRETQVDILYTEPQTDLDKVDRHGLIVLPFRHALSQVDFKVKNRVMDNEEIIIKSITIDGVKPKGTFNSLPSPRWTTEGDPVSLEFFNGQQETSNNPEDIGCQWNVVPQALSTKVTVEYEFRTSANTGFTLRLKTCDLETKLEPGRHYTYTLSVGIDDVKFLSEIIEDKFETE